MKSKVLISILAPLMLVSYVYAQESQCVTLLSWPCVLGSTEPNPECPNNPAADGQVSSGNNTDNCVPVTLYGITSGCQDEAAVWCDFVITAHDCSGRVSATLNDSFAITPTKPVGGC